MTPTLRGTKGSALWGKGGNGIARHAKRKTAFAFAAIALALAAPGAASAKQPEHANEQQDVVFTTESEFVFDLSGFDFLSNWVE